METELPVSVVHLVVHEEWVLQDANCAVVVQLLFPPGPHPGHSAEPELPLGHSCSCVDNLYPGACLLPPDSCGRVRGHWLEIHARGSITEGNWNSAETDTARWFLGRAI